VKVIGAAWRATTRIVAGVEDLVQRTGDGRTGWVLGGRVIERSGGVVCGLYHARGDEERGFLGCASKPRLTVCEWFDIKTLGRFLPVWPQTRWRRFLIGLGLKTDGDGL
jgi:hypothetical protein